MERSPVSAAARPRDAEAERAYLVAFCGHLTGQPGIAEDLAQETLIQAWRHAGQLRDPDSREAWLKAIARNVCRRWLRDDRPTVAHSLTGAAANWSQTPEEVEPAHNFDLEIELDRAELARLLDRAMALLPPETRAVLAERYIEERAQTDIALRLGLSEGAVAMRLQRGKLALRRILTTTFRDAASEFGVRPEEPSEQWRQTRIWCPQCGQLRLEGIYAETHTNFRLRCTACGPLNDTQLPSIFVGVAGYRAALNRLMDWSHRLYRHSLIHQTIPCPGCGETLVLGQGVLDTARQIAYVCRRCRWATFNGQGFNILALPESRRFWRDHPRIHHLPEREVESEGRPAIVVGIESLTDRARLEVVYARDSLDLIAIQGARPHR